MVTPARKGLLEVPQQFPGFSRVLTFLGQSLDEGDLLEQTPLALHHMPIRLGQVFAFSLRVGHGTDDHAPDRARAPHPLQMSPC